MEDRMRDVNHTKDLFTLETGKVNVKVKVKGKAKMTVMVRVRVRVRVKQPWKGVGQGKVKGRELQSTGKHGVGEGGSEARGED